MVKRNVNTNVKDKYILIRKGGKRLNVPITT